MILLYYLTCQNPGKGTLYEFNEYSMVYPLPTTTCSALPSTGGIQNVYHLILFLSCTCIYNFLVYCDKPHYFCMDIICHTLGLAHAVFTRLYLRRKIIQKHTSKF
jgi:hypothetical protein